MIAKRIFDEQGPSSKRKRSKQDWIADGMQKKQPKIRALALCFFLVLSQHARSQALFKIYNDQRKTSSEAVIPGVPSIPEIGKSYHCSIDFGGWDAQHTKDTQYVDMRIQLPKGYRVLSDVQFNISINNGNVQGPTPNFLQDGSLVREYQEALDKYTESKAAAGSVKNGPVDKGASGSFGSTYESLKKYTSEMASSHPILIVKAQGNCKWKEWPFYTEWIGGTHLHGTVEFNIEYMGTPEEYSAMLSKFEAEKPPNQPAVVPDKYPSSPSISVSPADNGNIVVEWENANSAQATIDTVQIQRREGDADFITVAESHLPAHQYIDQKVSYGPSYAYRTVTVYRDGSEATFSSKPSVVSKPVSCKKPILVPKDPSRTYRIVQFPAGTSIFASSAQSKVLFKTSAVARALVIRTSGDWIEVRGGDGLSGWARNGDAVVLGAGLDGALALGRVTLATISGPAIILRYPSTRIDRENFTKATMGVGDVVLITDFTADGQNCLVQTLNGAAVEGYMPTGSVKLLPITR